MKPEAALDRLPQLQPGDALLLVDVQRDFLPGGSLAVPHGERALLALDRLVALFTREGLPVYASRDWHPPGHCSFQARGGPWPPHAVAGTEGARFARELDLPDSVFIVSKGSAPEAEGYSAFEGTGLAARVQRDGVQRLFVGGLATDYCVLHSVLDARDQGLSVVVLRDAVAAVDKAAGDGERALAQMQARGAQLADSVTLQASRASNSAASATKPSDNSTS